MNDRKDDGLVETSLLAMIDNWQGSLDKAWPEDGDLCLRKSERTGRPLRGPRFLKELEERLGRKLPPPKAGKRPKRKGKFMRHYLLSFL